jgi:ABC-type branched-subunit amino acid transport system ATPase component/branched-subunit amino acid ABC-type transport system permease component
MDQFLPFVVSGITTGAVYGLLGVGVVLTYKTSGIFNFGHGAIAAVGAIVFHWLYVDHAVAWWLGVLLSVFVAGPIAGLVMAPIAARLARQDAVMRIVATIGLMLIVIGFARIGFGPVPIQVPSYIPHGQDTFRVSGVYITWNQVVIAGVAVLAVVALAIVFRYARLGLAMRAVVNNADLYGMQGRSPHAVRRVSWMIGCSFASLSGVLLVPLVGLDTTVLTFLVIQAFGAAAIGLFSNITRTFVGGLVIGIVAALSQKYVVSITWLQGVPSSLPFVILFLALLVLRPSAVTSDQRSRMRQRWRAPGTVQLGLGVLVVAGLATVPGFAGTALPYYTLALTTVVLLLSLGLLVRMSGQISLCHATFAAIGAVAFSQLKVELGLPWLLALFLAGLVVVPVGALIALPAIRLSGVFLALATFGFGIMVQNMLYANSIMFDQQSTSGRTMPLPAFAHTPKAFYFVALVVAILAALTTVVIARNRLGRLLRGLAGSPVAMQAAGLNTNVSRVLVFCVSAFLAGIAGAVYGVSIGFAGSSDPYFAPLNSLLLVAMLGLGMLFGEPWYAVVVAVGAVIPGYVHGNDVSAWLMVIFGAFALMSAIHEPPALPARLTSAIDRLARSRRRRLSIQVTEPPVVERPRPAPDGGVGLEVQDLSIHFGGLHAVDGLSLNAPLGRITGLIGPNGAGKTSTFDACSGMNARVRGQVRYRGIDVSKKTANARARLGLGRTFQRFELCDQLSVFENVRLGPEAASAGANPLRQLFASPASRRAVVQGTSAALQTCGIADIADARVGELSTGQRRLVELARCVAGPFDMLLLDEPSAGLEKTQVSRFAELLRRIVSENGVGILLVEHDMELVMDVCDHIYVLDFGRMIYEGSPRSVMTSDVVRTAYLGERSIALEGAS